LLTLLFIAFVAADNLQVAKDLVAFLRAHKNDTKAQDRAWEKANKIFAQTSDCMVFWEGLCPNPSGNGCGFYSTRVDLDRDFEKGDAWLYISQQSGGWQLFSDGVKQASGSGSKPFCEGALFSPLSKARYVANDGDTTGPSGPKYFCAQGFITLNYAYTRGQSCTGADTCFKTPSNNPQVQGCGSIAYSAVWADPNGHYDCGSLSNPPTHDSICYVTGGNEYTGAGFTSAGAITGKGYFCAGSRGSQLVSFYGGNANTPQNQFPNDCCVENQLITGAKCVAPNSASASAL